MEHNTCGKMRNINRIIVDHLRDINIDGRIILKRNLEKYIAELDLNGSGSHIGFCEHGAEPLDSIQTGHFLTTLLSVAQEMQM